MALHRSFGLLFLAFLASAFPHREALGPRGHAANVPAPTLRLARIFGNGMVLQRDHPIPVWGWASPGTRVSVSFHGDTKSVTSDSTGAWRVAFPLLTAGGPLDLVVRSGGESITVANIVIGDVWLASGQSNMEFPLSQSANASTEIRGAHDPLLRHFKVPTSWSNAPESDLAGGEWTAADPRHVGDFSAVGYFFARDLRAFTHVPIGIVNSTWGGSAIEAWMSRKAHKLSDSAWAAYLQGDDRRIEALRAALRAKIGSLPESDRGTRNGRLVWQDPALDDSDWIEMPVPSYWESNGFEGMDGIGWYRTSFILSDREAQTGVTLTMNAIDDDDITWINGVEVGRTVGYNKVRTYTLAPSALRAGANVLVVRVSDGGGGGGINASVSISSEGSAPRSLAGRWKFKVGAVALNRDGQQINKVPTVLYNKMIAPLLPFPIKGIIWYQGESNANNVQQASAYRAQFATLIDSWRREWSGGGRLPFLWVQLPNFGKPDSTPPSQSAWATQRESMAAALSLPATGQAITIDVGEAENLHPKNKQDVGARLALVAQPVAYGQRVLASGPTYLSHVVRGNKIVVSFSNIGNGLVSASSDASVGAFAIAGADKVWHWASARLVGNTVEVWSDGVASPVAVRYAWTDSPENADLYSREGLPAAPFRTDHW
jgi:sialate O-acetylesterase